jgi:5-methyltetrahydropteroyltriglutamate--homocysteine methyltransferase
MESTGCAIIGYPRIGRNRELKRALESYWSGGSDEAELAAAAAALRERHWRDQAEAGLDWVCAGDFSLYDSMLDLCVMLDLVPERFRRLSGLERYFAMARGTEDAPAMRMRKWFNTNYHYIVPELPESSVMTRLRPDASRLRAELSECARLGLRPKLGMIGPLTFLRLAEGPRGTDPLSHLPAVMEAYGEVIASIAEAAPQALIQMEEPILVADPDETLLAALEATYGGLCAALPKANIAVATYFEHASEALPILARLPLKAIALDFVHGRKNLDALETLSEWNCGTLLAGVVNGRGVWANDRDASLGLLGRINEALRGKGALAVSSSCSLLHVPYAVADEEELPETLKRKLAFAREKLVEVVGIAQAFESAGRPLSFPGPRDLADAGRDASYVAPKLPRRKPEAKERAVLQRERLRLPILPTTTIGSFPQTQELRGLRAAARRGDIDEASYRAGLERLTQEYVRFQEGIGLDVLVHGEFERTDMVEYFGERMEGFAFTAKGWVQSYGSRCVKPPVIHGDVGRSRPMTVESIRFAQSLTDKPLKAMLTGPITILTWSFVREDISRETVCMQIADALRKEILDLEEAGQAIIQVDEAAFKEAYPIRKADRARFEAYAVDAFRLATGGVRPDTQIHSHMCYSDFSDIMGAIEALDADVLSIEAARSGDDILGAFARTGYDRALGPGVYDIHSPRVPSRDEMLEGIRRRVRAIGAERLWINPDCGLKTRGWPETEAALRNMVDAARAAREEAS